MKKCKRVRILTFLWIALAAGTGAAFAQAAPAAPQAGGSASQAPAATAPQPAAAAPQASTQAAWTLGVARFIQVPSEVLLKARGGDVPGMGNLAALAAGAKPNALDVSLPMLLLKALSPLPPRRDGKDAPGQAPEGKTALWTGHSDGMLVEIAGPAGSASPSSAKIDGLVAGIYALEDSKVSICALAYDTGKEAPAVRAVFEADIFSVEGMSGAFLGALFPWISGGAVAVYDIATEPPEASLAIAEESAKKGTATLSGRRAFVFGDEAVLVDASMPGRAPKRISLAPSKDGYSRVACALSEGGGVPPAKQPSLDILRWKGAEEFARKDKRLNASLGRFAISVPLSVLSLGCFLLYSEARGRNDAYAFAMYASGAATVASFGFTVYCTVDTILRIIDLIKTAK